MIRPPEAAVEDLAEFLEPRSGHPWVDSRQWHLTLAFCASVPEHRVEELGEALVDSLARRRPLQLQLAGAGAFPHEHAASVLWMGVRGDTDALADLAAHVRRLCATRGAAPDGQAFHPHLTVSRLRSPQPRSKWLRVLETYSGPGWEADRVELVASHLARGARPRHETMAVAGLHGRGDAETLRGGRQHVDPTW